MAQQTINIRDGVSQIDAVLVGEGGEGAGATEDCYLAQVFIEIRR